MATIAELLIKLGMDDGGLDKGMSSSQSKLKSWGDNLKGIGTKLTAGVTLPLVAAGAAAINWASDQEEAGNKVDQVFKGNAKEVRQWAKSNKGSILLSNAAAMDAVATYGNMLTSMGFTTEAAAELSEGWVELAQDFSSFNNIPVEQGLNAIRAAVVGEYEPLRSLGVVIDDATVKAKAMEMGLWDGTGALDAQSRALAVNALVMEQTSNVQGDAARTADGFANRVRILKADLQDLGAEIGMRLLPYAERLVGWLIDMVERFGNLSPRMQTAILAIAGVAAALGPLLVVIGMMLPALGALATAIGFLLSPIGLLVVAIAALIGLGIYAFINDLWGVRDAVYAVLDALSVFKPVLTDIVDIFQAAREGNWAEVFDELKDALISLGQALFELQGIVVEALAGLLARFIDWAQGYDWRGLLMTVGQALFDGLMAGIEWAWPIVRDWLTDLPNKVLAALETAGDWAQWLLQKGSDLVAGLLQGASEKWPEVQTWLGTLPGLLLAAIEAAGDFAVLLLQKGRDLLQGVLDGLAEKLPVVVAWLALLGTVAFAAVGDVAKSLLQKGLDLIQGVIDGFNDRWETAQAWLAMVGTLAFAAVGEVGATLLQKGLDLIQGIIDGLNDRWATAQAWLSMVGSLASSAVGDLGGILYDAGSALMNGLWDGAKAVWESLASWLSAKKAEIAALKGPPREDARVLIENGRLIMQGLGVGLADGWANVEQQLSGYSANVNGLMSVSAAGVAGGYVAGPVYNVFTLRSEEFLNLLRMAENGDEFARGFGQQAGLYAGMP